MKKKVNGKCVNIDNIELFELAAEGLAMQSVAVSNTSDGLQSGLNLPLVKKYIQQYDIFFKSMPYPLYAIEADIKYATLGNFIKALSKETMTMWVDNGLNIRLDKESGMTLKIVNNTWSIVYTPDSKKDNTSLELYKDKIGYEEYKWVLDKIVGKEKTIDFYKEFMGEFVEACNNNPLVLKWELESILNFGDIPNRLELKEDKIIDVSNNKEYILDIYANGEIDTEETMQVWSLTGDKPGSKGVRHQSMRTYAYDVYSKEINEEETGRLEKDNLVGANNLFRELVGLKSANELKVFPKFVGVISDVYLVFVIERRLYVTKSNRLREVKDIAHGVELYTVENNKIYFIKSKRVTDSISKDTLYSYDIKDEKLRICKVIFSY